MVCKCHDLFCTCQSNSNTPSLSDTEILELYSYLKHGSDDHKDWLLKALFHYFKGTEEPTYKS